MFFAAERYHGFYSSPDGLTWTRLANQPGLLSTANCPQNFVICIEISGEFVSVSIRHTFRGARTAYSTRPWWMAYLVSSVLFLSCIFSRILARYVLIVAALSERSSAISLTVCPEAIRRST